MLHAGRDGKSICVDIIVTKISRDVVSVERGHGMVVMKWMMVRLQLENCG